MTAPATYLYALARASGGALGQVPGIGGRPVRLVGRDGLCGVASTVDLAEFGAEPLRHNVADLGWLERVAREHDAVVQVAAASLAVLPLRLGTVCADDDSARRRVEELRAQAEAALDLVSGHQEWGVKLYAVPPLTAPLAGAGDRPASGLEYLRRRRAEVDRRTLDAVAAAEEADAVFEELRALARLGRRHRLQDPALSGARHPMVLNAAYLVDRDRAGEFRAAVGRLAAARDADAIVLTGPWAPYSFVTMEDT